ncbi:DUF2490 domain-containing protein [bacterium]|nr:DUF2490 domain-containing protein [bacterium]
MKKAVSFGFALILLLTGLFAVNLQAEAVSTFNTWEYGNLNLLLSPEWVYIIMAGHRYELSTSQETIDPAETFLYEFFTGPVYIRNFGNLKFKMALWYYLMFFPQDEIDDFYSHNIEAIPILELSIGDLLLVNRVITHNKIYASNPVYDIDDPELSSGDKKTGYSLLIREMVQANYSLSDKITLSAADEVFIGLIEDSDTKDIAKGEPFFARKGFSRNRVYAGFNYRFTKMLNLSTQYVWELNYDPDHNHQLTKIRHYLFLTLNYTYKFF